MARRSVATCKRCGTQFVMVGEISGCVNCNHPELRIEPEPEDWLELTQIAEDLSDEDIDAFLAGLNKENEMTKKFIADLEAEFEMDQAIKELLGEDDPLFTNIEPTQKDWSKAPHDPACCCDKCAPTEKDRKRKVAEFEAEQRKEQNPLDSARQAMRKRNSMLKGNCRTCSHWNKLTAQAGSCPYLHESDRLVAPNGVRVSMWYETCRTYVRNSSYTAQQVEIRERRKAHSSIIRAMERSRT